MSATHNKKSFNVWPKFRSGFVLTNTKMFVNIDNCTDNNYSYNKIITAKYFSKKKLGEKIKSKRYKPYISIDLNVVNRPVTR